MNQPKNPHTPLTLGELNQKLDFESKRLVREREDGIVKRISKMANLNGTSTLVFEDINGAKVMMSYRVDTGGALRFAREKQFATTSQQKQVSPATPVGRTSVDIGK